MRTRFTVLSSVLALLALAGLVVLFLPGQAEAEYCESARITDLHADGHPPGIKEPGFMVLSWSLDINPWPEGLDVEEAVYRVHRRPAGSDTWELVDTVTNRTDWEGAPELGEWSYHVGLISLRTNGDTETCNGVRAETTLKLPTEAELVPGLLGELCERSEVVWLQAVRLDDGSLMLKWEDDLDYFYEDVEDDLRHWEWEASTFKADTVVYSVQRSATTPDNTPLGWVTLDETEERTWNGPAEPGHWTYRVGTIRMTKGNVAAECEPWYAEAHLHIQSAAEAAEQTRRSDILQAEATRCATATLTSNLQGEARQVVAGVVAERVAEIAADRKDENYPDGALHSLVALTVLLCAWEAAPTGDGPGGDQFWNTVILLDLLGFYW